MPEVKIEPQWKKVLKVFFESNKFQDLTNFVKQEYLSKKVFPSPENIFKAFWLTPFEKVKVVILGQDPYHGVEQAHGLSFSVPTGIPLPPSLQNIYKEIENEFEIKKDYTKGNLENWARQGVFLLNSVLTVVAGSPASHQKKGWEDFTDYVIRSLSEKRADLVFMLWGNFARSKKPLIDSQKHLVLESTHPSPFSAHKGFFGCNHFRLANDFLKAQGVAAINW